MTDVAHLHALRDLVDRQIMDRDALMSGKVDDLRFEPQDGTLAMTEILTGAVALGRRMSGRVGRVFEAVLTRVTIDPEPVVVPVALMRRTRTNVELTVTRQELAVWNANRPRERAVESLLADVFRLSDVVGAQVLDADDVPIGRVGDVRLADETCSVPFALEGCIVGAPEIGDRLGYGYRGAGAPKAPIPLSNMFRAIARHALYVPWEAVVDRQPRLVRLAVPRDALAPLADDAQR